MMEEFPLVSKIMEQSIGRTVEILNAIQSGSAAEKTNQEAPRSKTEPPAEDKEDSK